MDMTTHDLARKHAREDVELFSGEGILCPRHKASVIPNAG